MRWAQPLGVACLALGVALLVTATGGFSAADADRGFSVEVSDDSAYLGVDADVYTPQCKATVTVTNRFSTTLDEVRLESDHHSRSPHASRTIRELDPGESETVWMKVDRWGERHELDVEADGPGVDVAFVADLGENGCPPRSAPPDRDGPPHGDGKDRADSPPYGGDKGDSDGPPHRNDEGDSDRSSHGDEKDRESRDRGERGDRDDRDDRNRSGRHDGDR